MNYQDYRIVFQNYVLQPWNGVNTFSMSDDDRVLANQQSTTVYPQLQLDTPTFRPEINRGKIGKKTYYGQVGILSPVNKDDWQGEDDILDQLEPEMDALIAWLDYHRKLGFGTIREIGTVYPIKRHEHANLFGWAVQVTIEANESYCHDVANDVEVKHLTPVFEEGQETLQLEIESEVFSVQWKDESLNIAALSYLATEINAEGIGINARLYLESLVLVHSLPQTTINLDTNQPGHGWTIK